MSQVEIWKDIPGYEGYYQASNLGNVRSLFFFNNYYKIRIPREKVLVQTGFPYKFVTLCKDHKRMQLTVHRLIAKTFLDNKDNLPVVNHKDCNKYNNCVDNLEWCTKSQNELHAYANGKITANSKGVLLLDNDNVIKEWTSTNKCSVDMNISREMVSLYCRGRVKTRKYDLVFKEEYGKKISFKKYMLRSK